LAKKNEFLVLKVVISVAVGDTSSIFWSRILGFGPKY